jgi:hypothetical protein
MSCHDNPRGSDIDGSFALVRREIGSAIFVGRVGRQGDDDIVRGVSNDDDVAGNGQRGRRVLDQHRAVNKGIPAARFETPYGGHNQTSPSMKSTRILKKASNLL